MIAEPNSLTLEQQAVVDSDLMGPRLIDAGAGTGKTFTLVQRAKTLIQNRVLHGDELLVLTFTKAAATEIAARLEHELDPSDNCRPTSGTFHGVAGDLLREFSYEAGYSPDLRAVDDGRARGVFAQAFADLSAGRLAVDLSAFPLLERSKPLERSLASMAIALKARGISIADAIAKAESAVAELESINFGMIDSQKPGGKGSYAGWPRPNPPRSPEERLAEAQRERLNIAVVRALFERFQELLDAEHLLTFGDIIVRCTEMLQTHPQIAETLRTRWRHAIVDEFQDTNAEQILFLEAIFGKDLEPVLAVGDVRQAIFEFAGARPEGIIEFQSRVRERLPLTMNRRSLQPILDVAHAALDTLGGMDPARNNQLVAHRGDASATCVRLASFGGSDGMLNEAKAVAEAIASLIAGGTDPKRCAILLRARTRAGYFVDALRSRGIATQLHGGIGFFDAPEVREIVSWLRLASDPADSFALVGCLQSAAIALGDGAVAHLAASRDLAYAALINEAPDSFSSIERERLDRFRKTAHIVSALADAPLADAVRAIVVAAGVEIARSADTIALLQVRANVEKFLRFAADFGNDRPMARVEHLVEELRERDELELDLPIAELEGDRVPIMTIHGAKGLEWDHVFLVDVAQGTFPSMNSDAREKVCQFDEQSGAIAFKHAVDGRPTLRWYLTEYAHDESGQYLKSERPIAAEEHRLLYVALTRARNELYVTGRLKGKSSFSSCFKAVHEWAVARSGTIDPHEILCGSSADREQNKAAADRDLAQLQLDLSARFERAAALANAGAVAERSGRLSYTAMELYERCPRRARFHYVYGLPELTDDAPAAIIDADGQQRETRNPARFGRAVHLALELIVKARMSGLERSIGDAVDEGFASENWEPTATERATLITAVERAVVQLASLSPIDAERRFDVSIDGVGLGGYIDLLATDAFGKTLLVDYKTGSTEGHHYGIQFALYAYAVRDQFANPETRILRIGEDDVRFESVTAASEESLKEAVTRAKTMTSDEPRPGQQCTYCPYAGDACDAAR